jgi:glutathione S-transferase
MSTSLVIPGRLSRYSAAWSDVLTLYGEGSTPVLEVWGRKNSVNVQKVLWCCEELEIPFRRHNVGGLFGGTREAEYLARNPTGLVPTISDDGLALWESNTIVRYLSAKHGPGTLWPEDPGARALADKWMDYQLGTLWPAFKDAVLGLIRTPPEQRDQAKISTSVEATAEVLAILDAHLEDHEYVAGPSLTMGDVVLGSSVYRWLNLDIDRPHLSKLQAWHTRLEERPAYQRTVMVPFAKEDPARPEE